MPWINGTYVPDSPNESNPSSQEDTFVPFSTTVTPPSMEEMISSMFGGMGNMISSQEKTGRNVQALVNMGITGKNLGAMRYGCISRNNKG